MADVPSLLDHWGYLAIFGVVVLGNMGLPVPEEVVLALAGYLAWEGEMSLPVVVVVGVLSAVTGDNLGYWLGHRYGRHLIDLHGARILLPPRRVEAAERFIARRGTLAVIIARFLPGVRFVAGPVAGITRLPFPKFLFANIVGAAMYVPLAVGIGYAIGLGFGDYVQRLQRTAVHAEYVVIPLAIVATIAVLLVRALRGRGSRKES